MIFKNNKTFDALKWICMIAIPALCTAISQFGQIFGWEEAGVVSEVGVIICTLLGTLLGVSNYQYYKHLPTDESVYTLDMTVEESDDVRGEG